MKASNKFLTGILSLMMIAAVIIVPPMLAEEWKEEGNDNLVPTLELLSSSEILQTEHENYTENSTFEYYPYAELNATNAGSYAVSGITYVGSYHLGYPGYARYQTGITYNYLGSQDYFTSQNGYFFYDTYVYMAIDWYSALSGGATNLYFNLTTESNRYLNLRALSFRTTNVNYGLVGTYEILSFPGRLVSYIGNHQYYISLSETDINNALNLLNGYTSDHQLLYAFLRIGFDGGGNLYGTNFVMDFQAHPDFYEEETIIRTYHNYTTNETVYNNLTVLTPHLGGKTSYYNVAKVALGIGGGIVLLVALVASPFMESFNILLPATSNRSRTRRRR